MRLEDCACCIDPALRCRRHVEEWKAHFATSMGTRGTDAVLIKDGTSHGTDAVQFFRGDIDACEVGLIVLME